MSQTGAQIVTGLIPSEPIISNNNAESYVSADPACGLLGHFIWDFWGALIGLVTFVSLDARLIFQTSQSIQGGRLINYQVARHLRDQFGPGHRLVHIQSNYRDTGD